MCVCPTAVQWLVKYLSSQSHRSISVDLCMYHGQDGRLKFKTEQHNKGKKGDLSDFACWC